ncbi:MAG: Succinyl-CoA ligase (ADP-forming) subunit alpha [Microgenomates bacterium OLB23]|nr:MAG: Succinyl-CoA ligase (ADP-forming) subunit alpha [Microgenomates bacterium OLB23]
MNIATLLQGKNLAWSCVVIGTHPSIIQSMLDFDYLTGHAQPRIEAIIAGGRKFERYFFGKQEIAIPVYPTASALQMARSKKDTVLFVNVTSGRRAYASTLDLITNLPNVAGGVIFAENMPEQHATDLINICREKHIWIIGPASVGLLIPGLLKLGAIAGVDASQLQSARATARGNVAVFSASGGMTNELIWNVTKAGHTLSFALHFGGDRFPIVPPMEAFLAAESDTHTTHIVYYGELGGDDEYELVRLKKRGQANKANFCFYCRYYF